MKIFIEGIDVAIWNAVEMDHTFLSMMLRES